MKSHVVEPYKKQPQRNYNKRLGVIFNGEDNLWPTIVENLIDASPTAAQCAWLYQCFIGGGGFEEELQVNLSDNYWEEYYPNDLLFDVCEPVSRHQGAFIHVRYNALFEKVGFKLMPYALCRLGKADSKGYKGKIHVCDTGWGRGYKKDRTKTYDTYNPRPEVILAQVERDRGWSNYKGQIMFFKLDDKHDYPTSLIQRAYASADVENQLGMYYNSTVRRSFEDLSLIRHRKFEKNVDKDKFYDNLKKVSGVENASSKLILEDDWDDENKEGNIRIDTLSSKVKSDKYKHFEESSSNFIRKAFKNIPPQLVDYVQGKLGNTTGEDLIKAQALYSRYLARDRQKVQRLFAELFRNFKEDVNPSGDWTINPFLLIEDEKPKEENVNE